MVFNTQRLRVFSDYRRIYIGSNAVSLEQSASDGVLSELQGRAAAAGCYVTSKKGKDCHASQCPASEQCKVNDKGNCVYKNKKKDRPFGCEQCSCKKAS